MTHDASPSDPIADRHAAPDQKRAAVVLAGQRPGEDPVAAMFGLRAKALAPAFGAPLIDRVLQALRRSGHFSDILIVEDPLLEPLSQSREVADAVATGEARLIASQPTISESVASAISELSGAEDFIVTTADNALLTVATIDEFVTKIGAADVAVGMVERGVIEQSYPGIPRTYYRFSDTSVSGANLFLIRRRAGSDAIEYWRRFEQNRKNPIKVFAAFGFWNMIGGALHMISLDGAFRRLSQKFGCSIQAVRLSAPEAAIDVDKIADVVIADGILARRYVDSLPAGAMAPDADRNDG